MNNEFNVKCNLVLVSCGSEFYDHTYLTNFFEQGAKRCVLSSGREFELFKQGIIDMLVDQGADHNTTLILGMIDRVSILLTSNSATLNEGDLMSVPCRLSFHLDGSLQSKHLKYLVDILSKPDSVLFNVPKALHSASCVYNKVMTSLIEIPKPACTKDSKEVMAYRDYLSKRHYLIDGFFMSNMKFIT